MRTNHARERGPGPCAAVTRLGAICLGVFSVMCLPGSAGAQTIASCPGEMDSALTGLAGVVRDSAANVIIPGARVQAVWADANGARQTLSTETNERGVYLLCDLPSGRPLVIRALFASFATLPVSVTVAPGPPAGWDFSMPVEAHAIAAGFTVPGRILGRVMDRDSGRPVEAANIVLAPVDQRRFSDGSGYYLFDGMDPGVYRVTVEHLSYEDVDQLVDLPSDRTLEVNFELSADPIELEPLVITAIREKRLELQGFYDRRQLGERIGAGVYITREEIRRVGAMKVTHFLGRLNGVRTECTGSGNNNCTIRMTRGAPSLSGRAEYGCVNANVYIDGVRVIRDNALVDSIDNFVSPSEIAGIEVYRGPSELPAEFGGSVGRCGAVVIWTGPAGDG